MRRREHVSPAARWSDYSDQWCGCAIAETHFPVALRSLWLEPPFFSKSVLPIEVSSALHSRARVGLVRTRTWYDDDEIVDLQVADEHGLGLRVEEPARVDDEIDARHLLRADQRQGTGVFDCVPVCTWEVS